MPPKNRFWMAALAALLTTGFVTSTFAQMPAPEESSRQRAGAIRKQERRRAIDQAYEATRKRNLPEAKEKADPWAGLRDSQSPQKK